MRLYYAAAESALKELSEIEVDAILISMANGEKKIPKVQDYFKKCHLLVDSGAFTFQKKKGITVEQWIKKALNLEQYASEIISLDVIGDAQKSYDNYIEIKKSLDVIPTFHVGSDIEYLKKYLEHTNRIAIGGMVGLKSEITKLKNYLNEIFKLFNPKDLPKFHAFGYFSQQILEHYPFFSADATTWQNYSRFGEFHKFENFEYKRVKSLKVAKVDINEYNIKDLTTLKLNEPLEKLARIKEAVDNYEEHLTMLWQKRGVIW